jgi:hypothetical protein
MELKPCWCGNTEIAIVRDEWLSEPCRLIKCHKCGLMVMRLTRMRPEVAKREVEKAWNERPYYEQRIRKRGTG